jgi:hypothetical protein
MELSEEIGLTVAVVLIVELLDWFGEVSIACLRC